MRMLAKMSNHVATHAAAVLALMSLLAGCGGPGYELAPVSGQVLLDGQPLADAHLTFEPLAVAGQPSIPGVGSIGITDSEGRYTLETVDSHSGAVVGTHRVWITTAYATEGDPHDDFAPTPEDRVPPAYRDGSLRFEAPPEGADNANFVLHSSPP